MSYTKLEWRVATKEDNCVIGKVDDSCGEYNGIAAGAGFVGNGFLLSGYISKADVTLMAAAPALLEALQQCKEWIEATPKDKGSQHEDSRCPIWLAAQAAIAKATE